MSHIWRDHKVCGMRHADCGVGSLRVTIHIQGGEAVKSLRQTSSQLTLNPLVRFFETR